MILCDLHYNFNSHPHKEDDHEQSKLKIFFIISTHILTRRMTEKDDDIESEADISTHILTRRMTWLRRMPLAALRYFNSHPHKEDDRNGKKVAISKKYFNSHPHKEDDSAET